MCAKNDLGYRSTQNSLIVKEKCSKKPNILLLQKLLNYFWYPNIYSTYLNVSNTYRQYCTNTSDTCSSYRCTCVTGMGGKICQVDEDDCKSNPCLNGATCQDEVATYTCRCAPGFNGSRCETGIDTIKITFFTKTNTDITSSSDFNR